MSDDYESCDQCGCELTASHACGTPNPTGDDTKKVPCDCPKGGYIEYEDGKGHPCQKCDGTEWVDAPAPVAGEEENYVQFRVDTDGGVTKRTILINGIEFEEHLAAARAEERRAAITEAADLLKFMGCHDAAKYLEAHFRADLTSLAKPE